MLLILSNALIIQTLRKNHFMDVLLPIIIKKLIYMNVLNAVLVTLLFLLKMKKYAKDIMKSI